MRAMKNMRHSLLVGILDWGIVSCTCVSPAQQVTWATENSGLKIGLRRGLDMSGKAPQQWGGGGGGGGEYAWRTCSVMDSMKYVTVVLKDKREVLSRTNQAYRHLRNMCS